MFSLFELEHSEVLLTESQLTKSESSSVSSEETRNLPPEAPVQKAKPTKKSKLGKYVIAYPKGWAEGFGDGYYEQLTLEQLEAATFRDWNTESSGVTYDTHHLETTSPEEVAKQIHLLINEFEHEVNENGTNQPVQ